MYIADVEINQPPKLHNQNSSNDGAFPTMTTGFQDTNNNLTMVHGTGSPSFSTYEMDKSEMNELRLT